MTIDPEINIAQMHEKWANGNCTAVLTALSNDHPGLTALFLLKAFEPRDSIRPIATSSSIT